MVYDPTASMKQLQTILAASGYFTGGVLIGEPFSPPDDLSAAIFCMDLDPSSVPLSTTIDVWTFQVRLYMRAGMTPADAEATELALAKGVSEIEAALAAGFTLGGAIRAIDWVGEEAGHRVAFKWGHLTLAQTVFRCVDVTVPLIVDDSGTFVP